MNSSSSEIKPRPPVRSQGRSGVPGDGSTIAAPKVPCSTVQKLTGGRVAAISVPVDQTEKLVTIIELKKRGETEQDAFQRLAVVKNDVTSAISNSHGLNVADLVLVQPGSIPSTTSGRIRRSACVEHYGREQFIRLDA
jgi:fatty acid CoA ligase FadD21